MTIDHILNSVAWAFSGLQQVEKLPAMQETQKMQVQIPKSPRSPGGGHGNPPQYSCLGNPTDRGAWGATVHGVAKSWTRLSNFTFTFFPVLHAEKAYVPETYLTGDSQWVGGLEEHPGAGERSWDLESEILGLGFRFMMSHSCLELHLRNTGNSAHGMTWDFLCITAW